MNFIHAHSHLWTPDTERLMWASDSSFQVVNGHTCKASIDLVKSNLDFLPAPDLDSL